MAGDTLEPCYCTSKQCDGALRTRSQRIRHTEADRRSQTAQARAHYVAPTPAFRSVSFPRPHFLSRIAAATDRLELSTTPHYIRPVQASGEPGGHLMITEAAPLTATLSNERPDIFNFTGPLDHANDPQLHAPQDAHVGLDSVLLNTIVLQDTVMSSSTGSDLASGKHRSQPRRKHYTPNSERQQAIMEEEHEGMLAITAAYARVTPEALEPLEDDDWEDIPEEGAGDLDNACLPEGPEPLSPLAQMDISEDSTPSDDPFRCDPQPARPPPASAAIHANPVVFLIYLLVIWLHTQFKLAFRACNAVLVILAIIMRTASISLDPPLSTTLTSVLQDMDIEPKFYILPVCPQCKIPYPATVSAEATCTRCGSSLFNTTPTVSQQRQGKDTRSNPIPYLRFPYLPLADQLMELIPEIEDLVDAWRMKPRIPGTYSDHFDGRICRELVGPDGLPFFRPDLKEMPNGEIRLGVTLGADWFSYHRSLIAPSHSSAPMSFNVINLEPSARYKASNLLLFGVMPGPKEQDVEEIQHFLRIVVDELLRLWKDGIQIVTKRYPNERLVRVALVGVLCDKPAAHKIGGYGSHSHTFFCTICWIMKGSLATPRAFERDAFPPRTDAEHRRLQSEYCQCSSKTARVSFVKLHATRWSELSRLPYFNFQRMIVVDPMHNLILGLVKTHFYSIWVKTKILRPKKELRRLHGILAKMSLPAKVGRLPSLIGEPAGGSLTADQWLVLVTVIGPLAIPQVWQDYMPDDIEMALAQRKAAITANVAARRQAAVEARRTQASGSSIQATSSTKRKRTTRTTSKRKSTKARAALPESTQPRRSGRAVRPTERLVASRQYDEGSDDDNIPDDGAVEVDDMEVYSDSSESDSEIVTTPAMLHPLDVSNFFKLCSALQILLSGRITDTQLEKADTLLREYCTELINLYGPSAIKPNHHYATHTVPFVQDYGPLHCFWTFLFERMNKVLKSYHTNNHGGGELETTFFREFQRTVRTARILANASRSPTSTGLPEAVIAMFKASSDDRGTVQALAQELDERYENDGILFRLSKRSETADIPVDLYTALLHHFQHRLPVLGVLRHWLSPPLEGSVPLTSIATFFDHGIIRQQKFLASRRLHSTADSLVYVRTSSTGNMWVGELRDIFCISQDIIGLHRFGYMRWLQPLETETNGTVWEYSAGARVRLWTRGQYLPNEDRGPNPLIDLQDILAHAVLLDVSIGDMPAWATIFVGSIGNTVDGEL